MTKDLKERLHKAILDAIERQHGAFTGGDVAASLKRSDADLWDEAREILATEKVIAIANGMIRGPLHQANSAQLELAGFEDIPKYIRAGTGKPQGSHSERFSPFGKHGRNLLPCGVLPLELFANGDESPCDDSPPSVTGQLPSV